MAVSGVRSSCETLVRNWLLATSRLRSSSTVRSSSSIFRAVSARPCEGCACAPSASTTSRGAPASGFGGSTMRKPSRASTSRSRASASWPPWICSRRSVIPDADAGTDESNNLDPCSGGCKEIVPLHVAPLHLVGQQLPALQQGVGAAALQQLVVGALLHDAA